MTAAPEALFKPRPLPLGVPEAAGRRAGGREALDRQVCPAGGWVERGAEGGTRVLSTHGRLPPWTPPCSAASPPPPAPAPGAHLRGAGCGAGGAAMRAVQCELWRPGRGEVGCGQDTARPRKCQAAPRPGPRGPRQVGSRAPTGSSLGQQLAEEPWAHQGDPWPRGGGPLGSHPPPPSSARSARLPARGTWVAFAGKPFFPFPARLPPQIPGAPVPFGACAPTAQPSR